MQNFDAQGAPGRGSARSLPTFWFGRSPWFFGVGEIERRPRGASRAALAPTFVSGQLFLWDSRANALAYAEILRRTNKAVARACHRHDWPETNVGASAARDAPRGRRSISPAPKNLRRTHQLSRRKSGGIGRASFSGSGRLPLPARYCRIWNTYANTWATARYKPAGISCSISVE